MCYVTSKHFIDVTDTAMVRAILLDILIPQLIGKGINFTVTIYFTFSVVYC